MCVYIYVYTCIHCLSLYIGVYIYIYMCTYIYILVILLNQASPLQACKSRLGLPSPTPENTCLRVSRLGRFRVEGGSGFRMVWGGLELRKVQGVGHKAEEAKPEQWGFCKQRQSLNPTWVYVGNPTSELAAITSNLWGYPYLNGLHYKGGLYGISLS